MNVSKYWANWANFVQLIEVKETIKLIQGKMLSMEQATFNIIWNFKDEKPQVDNICAIMP